MTGFQHPSPGGIVLLYHRVARAETDPQLLAVTPEHFGEHLQVLNRLAVPLALREMRRAAQRGRMPANAVAVTFDDGYADNFCEAAPLIERHAVPATIFATTGHTDTSDEFFWDELDRLLLQPNTLPRELTLNFATSDEPRFCDTGLRPVRAMPDPGEPPSPRFERFAHGPEARVTIDKSGPELTVRRFDLTACTDYSGQQWRQDRHWNVLEPASPGSRQQLYLELCSLLHPMTSRQRQACLRQVQQWAGCGSVGRESNRMMSSSELREISRGGLIEVGAHTVTHPLLAAEHITWQIEEIRASRVMLEAILDRPVTSFSYPFGTRRDYSAATVEAVAAEGFERACSNFTGKVIADTDPFQLPRMIVRDWDGDEFARRLAGWFAMSPISKPVSRDSAAKDLPPLDPAFISIHQSS